MLSRFKGQGQGELVKGTGGQGDTVTRAILSNLILKGFLGKVTYESAADSLYR
jgi:hypothetical protein